MDDDRRNRLYPLKEHQMFLPLWRAVPQPKDGMLEMPTAPGLGLEFEEAAIEKYHA